MNKQLITPIFVLLVLAWMVINNPNKTEVILEANADYNLTFGSELQESQEKISDLYLLQKSISICEGGLQKDSLPYRNNNPGNIKSGALRDSQGHGMFNTYTEGYLEHLKLLQRRYWGHTPKYMNHVLGYATDPNWYKCVNYYYND